VVVVVLVKPVRVGMVSMVIIPPAVKIPAVPFPFAIPVFVVPVVVIPVKIPAVFSVMRPVRGSFYVPVLVTSPEIITGFVSAVIFVQAINFFFIVIARPNS
jgi:hypothetical protein